MRWKLTLFDAAKLKGTGQAYSEPEHQADTGGREGVTESLSSRRQDAKRMGARDTAAICSARPYLLPATNPSC